MEIKVFVEIPALDHLAEVLSGKIANRKEVPTRTEMNTGPAAAAVSFPESAAAVLTPEPAAVTPTPEPAAVTPAPVQTATAPITPVSQGTAPIAPVSPGAAPTYTRDQLAKAATDHLMPQRMPELTSLLASFGVPSLMDLPENRFGEFATALRGLGAKI